MMWNESDVGVKIAKADCYKPSAHYKGPCFQSDNCNGQCTSEGHPGGECQGLFPRRCMCICWFNSSINHVSLINVSD